MLFENTGSYTPDFAGEIDSEEEIAADEYGVSIETAKRIIKDREDAVRHHQAETLGKIVGQLLAGNNLTAKVHSLAIAIGFDQLNGFHSQSEIARELGCTRALISHYVISWRDALEGGVFRDGTKFNGLSDCLKFRKRNETRKIYREKATSQTLTQKRNNRHEHH